MPDKASTAADGNPATPSVISDILWAALFIIVTPAVTVAVGVIVELYL